MNVALILAGGTGARMGEDIPKQFLILDSYCESDYNDYVFIHTLRQFVYNENIDAIYFVCHSDWVEFVQDEIITIFQEDFEQGHTNTIIKLLDGGETRQESSLIGLNAISQDFDDDTIILIHDCARPFITQTVINDNIQVATQTNSAVTVLNASDTILTCYGDYINDIPIRANMYHAQTPQTFKLGLILDGHLTLTEEQKAFITDDSSILVRQGEQVSIVIGEASNIKITNPIDMQFARAILQNLPEGDYFYGKNRD